ncbi:MAG TPA: alpha/beta hydrolase [Flavitalea sp.]|nr:alpha/beta hydrolase [Flavitalea sp.]
MTRKSLFRLLKITLLIYAIGGIVIYYLQDRIFYHPEKLAASFNYKFGQPFKEVNIPYNKTSTINVIQFHTQGQPKGVVIYFHGNRQNIAHYAEYAKNFTSYGYEVWMFDYPGFGKSTGTFTEQMIYNWSLVVYKLARVSYLPSQIIFYGKSLGTGFATQLASIRDCKYLLLETPYYSLPYLLHQYLPVYPGNIVKMQVPTAEYIRNVTAPITIFQGTDDWTVTPRNCEKLRPLLKPTDTIIMINDGKHNDLPTFESYKNTLKKLLQ